MTITNEGYAIISDDTHIGKWVKQNKRLDFDQNTLPFILKYIKKGDVIIDAGANIGAYSYAFLNKTEDGLVVSFEPNQDAFECLSYNLQFYKNSVVFNCALGDKSGKVSIVKDKNAGATHCVFDPVGDINMRTIDSYNLQKVDFIKIDVEGFESFVLTGAIKTIQKFKPTMLIEINRGALEKNGMTSENIFSFLYMMGYSCKNIYPNEIMGGEQYDIICEYLTQ